MMQGVSSNHPNQVGNTNTGMPSMANVSSPRSMLAIGRGRGSMMNAAGSMGHMHTSMPTGNMQITGQNHFSGHIQTGQLGGKPMGNMGNIPGVSGNLQMSQMQGMGRAAGVMVQRGKLGKKGKSRNVAMPNQGGPVGKGKVISGATVGGAGQGGVMNCQGGKPAMGMFPQGGNSISTNVSGGKPLTGNMMGSGQQQWGSNSMMSGIQTNAQFGATSSSGQALGSGTYGGGTPAQPPPHYNAALAQQQMMQSASGGGASHLGQGPRFTNTMNTGGAHNTVAPMGHTGKQALQNMLRARGPSQFMSVGGNNPSNVGNNPPGNPSQFVPPRQNFQGAQNSNASLQGAAGGTSNRFGAMGGPSSSASSANPRMPSQFNTQNVGLAQSGNNPGNQFNSGNYGGGSQGPPGSSSGPMQNMNTYMMRGPQPGGYGSSSQIMMNRQNVMGGNISGTPGGAGGFMSRMGQGNYMQSPNVNMGNMTGHGYRNMGSGMPQQAGAQGNISSQSNMMERMRMQNPQLLAQLQRGPANAPSNPSNQQMGNAFQQNRF